MSKFNRLIKKNTLYLFILFSLIITSGFAHAAATPAGTIISNIAFVNYEITGTPQVRIETPPTTFMTDRKLDLNVAEASEGSTIVAPGDQGTAYKCLGFDVTNEGNATFDFLLTIANQAGGLDPFGGTDNFNVTTGFAAVVDNGDSICNAADTATYIDNLALGGTVRVWVRGDIPLAQIEGDIAAVILTAQIAESTGTPGAAITTDDSGSANNPADVDDVLADGTGDTDNNNDGKDSDTDSFKVANAVVSAVKSVSILDPLGGTDPITGAVLTYTISITVSGSATALNVVITDTVPANTTYKPGTLTLDASILTDSSDADAGDVGASTPGTVTISLGNLTSASPAHTITFKATIN
ncbi:MAG: DUF11 domain-containing protein [Thermodesulfovibrionia bacterium]|nr:DUF11 domain-containing protein [Thermodesulfovibrionia bacterium]